MTAEEEIASKNHFNSYEDYEYIIAGGKASYCHSEKQEEKKTLPDVSKSIKPAIRGAIRRPNTSSSALSVQWAAHPELTREARALLVQLATTGGVSDENGPTTSSTRRAGKMEQTHGSARASRSTQLLVNPSLVSTARALRVFVQRDAGRRAIAQIPGFCDKLTNIMQASLDVAISGDNRWSMQVIYTETCT